MLTLIAVILFFLSSTCGAVGFPIKTIYGEDSSMYYLIDAISGCIWLIAQTFVYILLISRLKIAFQGTKYQFSKIIFILFYFGLILFILIMFTKNIIIAIHPFSNNDTFDYTLAVFNFCLETVDLILSICLVYLFIKKLLLITMETARNENETFTNYNYSNNKKILSSLLNVVVKYTILSVNAVLITQILLCFWTITDLFAAITGNPKLWDWKEAIENFIWGLEMIVNCVCIILYLPNTDWFYDKLCHGCHALCKLWFMKHATKKMEQSSSFQVNLLPVDAITHNQLL